jgi:hypothetical protein
MSIKKAKNLLVAAGVALMANSAFAVEMVRVGQTPEEERCHRYVKESPEKNNKPYRVIYQECAKQFEGINGGKAALPASAQKGVSFTPRQP